MFAWVIEEARRRQAAGAPAELVLEVDPSNTRAIALYRAWGFVQIGSDNSDGRGWLIMAFRLS